MNFVDLFVRLVVLSIAAFIGLVLSFSTDILIFKIAIIVLVLSIPIFVSNHLHMKDQADGIDKLNEIKRKYARNEDDALDPNNTPEKAEDS